MTFLNHILLWGLPAVSLPLIIHLLNRLRYRSVDWAAVMFLITATRSSTRHAKLRQYLILLARMLLLLFLLLALARPLVGGWLGLTMAGAPDTIIVLLDRSASMEAIDPRRQTSKRTHALNLFMEAAETTASSSSFVLIESVLCVPQELAGPTMIDRLATASATDTSADIPAMIRSALDYMIRNQTGRTEIWLASDFQQSNWRPDSREWQDLSAQISSLPQDVRVRALNLGDPYRRNMSIILNRTYRHHFSKHNRLELELDMERTMAMAKTFPMIMTLDGNRSQFEMDMNSQSMRVNRKIDLPDEDRIGWGKLEIPSDENEHDNSAFFVYGKRQHLKAIVSCIDPLSRRYLKLATVPAPGLFNASCESVSPDDLNGGAYDELALLVWQAELDELDSDDFNHYISSGGIVVCFPPGKQTVRGKDGKNVATTLGIKWAETEESKARKPYLVATWEENEGPTARAANGDNLPLARLSFRHRQNISIDADSKEKWHSIADFSDGKPFMLRRKIGKGSVYVVTSLPRKEWSNLGDGDVLVPVLQRMLSSGGERLSEVETASCGQWKPVGSQEIWTSVDCESGKDIRWHSGIYQSGKRLLALNIPPEETIPDIIDNGTAAALFGDIPSQIQDNLGKRTTDKLQSEIWHIFLYCALACMVIESALLIQERSRRPENGEPAK